MVSIYGKCKKCLGGWGRGLCGDGWGCRCALLLGALMATDAGERGEPLQRGGEHLLPTCTVGER